MKRRLFSLAAGVSLLMMIGVATVWVRSYWVHDLIQRSTESIEPTLARSTCLMFSTARGRLVIGHMQDVQDLDASLIQGKLLPPSTRSGWEWIRDEPRWNGPGNHWFNALGFGYMSGGGIHPGGSDIATFGWIPYWFVILTSAILPTAWTRSFLRQSRRLQAGHCSVCGYDLRATPDRCPECGHVPAGVVK